MNALTPHRLAAIAAISLMALLLAGPAASAATATRQPVIHRMAALPQPPPQWTEYGPTARSGNNWTVAVDPRNARVEYAGSSWGGVWKTTTGGDSWLPAWRQQALIGITRLAMLPGNPQALYALDRNGTVWRTDDGAASWHALPGALPGAADTYNQGGFLAVEPSGVVYGCSNGGLFAFTTFNQWENAEPFVPGTPPGGTHLCSDVVRGPDGTLYAAFRDIGVWMKRDGPWKRIKHILPQPAPASRPIRIAVNRTKIVLNDDCQILVNSIGNLGLPRVENTWTNKGKRCGLGGGSTQGGYAMSVALSPIDDKHFIVTANDAYLTTDGGSSWKHLSVGQDDHDTVFLNDRIVYMATDNGPRVSYDGGRTWREAEHTSRVTDGPPIKEYYNLTVSGPDRFGRVWVGGNAQDSGAVSMVGRRTGFGCCGGESGLSVAAPQPSAVTDPLGSRFRIYATDAPGGGATGASPQLFICDMVVPGPVAATPPGVEEGYYPVASSHTCGSSHTFTSAVRAVAVHPVQSDLALVGLDSGMVYRSALHSDGKRFAPLLGGSSGVTAIYFASPSVALVGRASGLVQRLEEPFSGRPRVTVVNVPASGPVVAFASRPGDSSELYVAYATSIWKTLDGGRSWSDVTGAFPIPGSLRANLALGMEITGLARDAAQAQLYVAVGHRNWSAGSASASMVWRSVTPATGDWGLFGQGLPLGVPITGIASAPDHTLYLSTMGRGIWWRHATVTG